MKSRKPYRIMMICSMCVMGAATLCLLVMACMQVFGKWDLWDSVPTFTIVIMAALAAVMLLGMFAPKISLKMLGNYALHVGLVVFLVGGLVYYCTGDYINVRVPVSLNATYGQIQRENGELLDLGFEFGVYGFKVERYEPSYDVYEKKKNGAEEIVIHDVSVDKNGYFDFGKYGKKHYNDLRNADGTLVSQFYLSGSGDVFAKCKTPVKYYEGSMSFTENGVRENRKISVNHPVRQSGWKIYLMSYDEVNNAVALAFKYDPGEAVCLTGIILAMLGAFYQCIVSQFIHPKPGLRQNEKGGGKPLQNTGKSGTAHSGGEERGKTPARRNVPGGGAR